MICAHGIEASECRPCARAEQVQETIRLFELAERNAEALRNWRLRLALKIPCPDALSERQRAFESRVFEDKWTIAKRWCFKNRCERKAAQRQDWRESLPAMVRRQAD